MNEYNANRWECANSLNSYLIHITNAIQINSFWLSVSFKITVSTRGPLHTRDHPLFFVFDFTPRKRWVCISLLVSRLPQLLHLLPKMSRRQMKSTFELTHHLHTVSTYVLSVRSFVCPSILSTDRPTVWTMYVAAVVCACECLPFNRTKVNKLLNWNPSKENLATSNPSGCVCHLCHCILFPWKKT